MNKILYYLIVFIITSNLYANNDPRSVIYDDIKNEFKTDFDIWGVEFNKKKFIIRFTKDEFLFQKGSVRTSELFNVILQDFSPRYIAILSKHKDKIEKIIIKGHTSSENKKGNSVQSKYERNLILSQERADKVLSYTINLESDDIQNNIEWLEEKIAARGFSSSELIYNKDGSENKELSRRIEFQVIFTKDIYSVYNKTQVVDEADELELLDEQKKVITLQKYTKKLLVENPTLNEQYELINSIKQDIKIAQTAFNPTITLNSSYKNYHEYDVENIKTQRYNTSNDISIRYNIFNKFQDRDEERITKYNYQTTIYAKEQIENDLIYSLAEAFLTIQKTYEYYELSRENYGEYIVWLEKEELRFQNGLISLKDFSKIQARSITRFMNFEEDTKRYLDSITTMQKYIDFDEKDIEFFEVLNPQSEYFENPILALNESKILSPYMKEANQNIKLYKAKLDKAKISFYPTLNLVAKKSRLNEHDVEDETITDETSISLEASLSLYSGGKEAAEYKKKLLEYRQKIQKRDSVVRDVTYKVDMAYSLYELNMVKYDFLVELVNRREEEYIASNYDYKFSKIDANGLLDVVDSVYNAKRQYIENKYDMILSKYKVLTQIGVIKDNILY
ncbi:MAG: TolC family protein [Campylobacterota bacterium]|nr:TolC family protein [Campylobacterota bacterium]